MNTAKRFGGCGKYERWLTPYADDELDAVHILELETHLDECDSCTEFVALTRSTRSSLRLVAREPAPAGLRERMQQAMQRELAEPTDESPPVAAGDEPKQPIEGMQLVKLRYILPLAAAAAIALVFAGVRLGDQDSATVAGAKPTNTALAAKVSSLDTLLEDLVDRHVDPPPPEVTDPQSLVKFTPYVGVRVRNPQLTPFDKRARYVGARVQPVRRNHAAMLQYVVRDKHRVTIYVFDSKRVPVKPRHLHSMLKRRTVKSKDVYVGRMRGFSIAAAENKGVGYALASDLTDDENAELMLVAAK